MTLMVSVPSKVAPSLRDPLTVNSTIPICKYALTSLPGERVIEAVIDCPGLFRFRVSGVISTVAAASAEVSPGTATMPYLCLLRPSCCS